MPRVSRAPSHASSWYAAEPAKLEQQIDAWLAKAGGPADGPGAAGVIAPHAGYSYCGHVMAHAYRHIKPDSVLRVFVLGPSHYLATRKCMLSPAAEYSTPLGKLAVDAGVYAELRATGAFETMSLDADEARGEAAGQGEGAGQAGRRRGAPGCRPPSAAWRPARAQAEHSLELHTPYIAKIMAGRPFTLVPIMVGALSTEGEASYGRLLAPYLGAPGNVFVVSSDFCHWGGRFRYTWTRASGGPIWGDIEWLDRAGMEAIAGGDPAAFTAYLAAYRNTICGRHPIAVLLQMVSASARRFSIEFNCYDQSSKATAPGDSSVSYASAVVTAL
ncbi:memo1 [Scenedesmus sp. PABB004]|nr:memo1 [Scenedesmus sp. PABB004]